ncbi:MAG TPA: hypothetical protein VKR32_10390 [Puia sp.]|nr:hypothetical protein [Puia sp.]
MRKNQVLKRQEVSVAWLEPISYSVILVYERISSPKGLAIDHIPGSHTVPVSVIPPILLYLLVERFCEWQKPYQENRCGYKKVANSKDLLTPSRN